MKRTALTIVSLASLAAMGSAHAQSSVTLYGLIDTSLTYVNHMSGAKNGWMVSNSSAGDLAGSRWGIKGSEDLGSGLKAIFLLENGFNPNSGGLGQDGRLFGRQAFVGLTSDRAGTVTFGRQYDPLVDLIQPITADNYLGSVFATAGDIDNYDNSFRVDNAVKYTSPIISGVQFETMYSFGGVAGSTGSKQSYSAALSYNGGPLSVAGGYFYAANANANAVNGMRTTWSSTADGTFNGPINSGYASAHSIGIARIAGQYVFGRFTAGAGYSNAQYRRDDASTFSRSEHYNTGQGFLLYQATPVLLVGAGYSYTKSSGDTSATYHQVSIGTDYTLSKRTDLYMTAAYQHASGTTRDAQSNAPTAAQASVGSYGYAGTSSQTLVNLGLRHRF